MERQQQWQLERGPYLGEVSALCFLHHHSPTGMNTTLNEKDDAYSPPPPQFPFPFLLAGTGSEIFLYLLPNGINIASFQVFEGIRVHGITSQHRRRHCSHLDSDSASASSSYYYTIAVFGERRVKLYNLSIVSNGIDYNTSDHWEFTLLHSLPKFTHWVLDVCFLESGSFGSDSSNHQGGYWLAIGCSDNSVWFWDILSCHVVSQVRCPDRCLLYSMRMWGSNVESLLIASGTIYNQIIVWKLDFENHSRALTDHVEGLKIFTTEEADHFCGRPYQVVYLCRLTGHEGSIFRIAWSLDGSKLVSASDDRSARVWVVNTRGDGSCSPKDIDHLVGPVLFGHSARVWDCCIFNNLIVTAGEDCTCRVWGQAGDQLKVIKEHIGRGVWRCLYDPITSVIVTAGLDSALKVYQIHSSSSKSSKGCTGSVEDSLDRNEIFTFSLPTSSGKIGLTDSKSEYVRCLHFSCENSLYVSTNNGYLHHIPLDTGEEKWTELVHLDEGAPVVCMDLLSETSKLSDTVEDWIAMGNGKGSLMVVRVVGHIWSRKVNSTLVWSAETERQLLGTYWCKSLGNRFIFTADPRGQLKLWRLWGSLPPDCESADLSHKACLIATYISCFGTRIMCLDASAEDEVLVCGDIRGNILLFTLSRSLLSGTFVPSEVQTSPVSYFKGAHGISSVCSISIISSSVDEVEICSTGQDGCICSLEFNKIWQSLEFLGMKSVKELSVVRSVFWNGDRNDDLESKGYAVGFTSSDFIIWNLTADTKVLKVACGGWRRPHSFYIGNFPETNTCFAFVKNEIIYVHRNWLYKREKELYPQNLHLQFHGREIHSVCFIMKASEYGLDKNLGVQSKTIGIATGSEDGTVRLSRYEPGSKNWVSSTLLGEHVGGSAVRSLYCVSKMHIVVLDVTCLPAEIQRKNENLEEPKNPLLLISVGAKRVVTAWKQRLAMRRNREEDCFHGSSFSFQWLSSDMPTKDKNHDKRQNTEIEIEGTRNAYTRASKFNVSADVNNILKDHLEDKCEDDWRYLAVTAFLVKVAESRISVCFVVVASSDATVTLRALLLPCRLWFDVAILSPSSSPVLALQNVVESISPQIDDNILVESIYIVISGSTDGSITFWDLTKDVYDFLRQVSSLHLKDLTGSHKRPRTGRGSQGGRWRRTICGHVMKKKPGGECKQGSHFQKEKKEDDSLSDRTLTKDEKHLQNHTIYRTSGTPFSGQHEFVSSEIQDRAFVSEENSDYPYTGVGKIAPLHVVNSVHQSGVNCLYVSNRKDMEYPENKSTMYYVLSGGDDQALNCLRFELVMKAASQKCQNSLGEENSSTVTERVKEPIYSCQIQKYVMNVLPLEKVMSAHGSAVKGVWTDGSWAFSTGLDQRIRCWKFDQLGKLIECAHLIVSVPEPEALDAHCCGRGRYQIIVAGRGMQMVEFRAAAA